MRIEVNEWQYKVDYTSIRTKGREPDTDGSLVFIGDIMAIKSLRFCRHRGCGELTPSIYCDKHQAEHKVQRIEAKARYDELRGTATQRGYDADWRRARDAWLRQHPICTRCENEGRVTAATMVHHVQAIRDGGARLNSENFMSLCFDCHEVIEGRRRG